MLGINVMATGSYSPANIVTNDDFAKIMDTSDEWIYTRTGMKERRLSQGEPTWFMAKEAGKKALERANIDPLSIDLIVVASITGDFSTPSISCIVQRELGMKNATAFDINGACTGFIFAMETARNYFLSGNYSRALIIGAENLTKTIDYSDRGSCILFGDGASSAIIEKAENKKFFSYTGSKGSGAKYMVARNVPPYNPFMRETVHIEDNMPESNKHYLYMDGKEVYKFAISALPKAVKNVLKRAEMTVDELDVIIPHQANMRIIETACQRMNSSLDKFFVNIEKYGNTSSASIPLAFDEAITSGAIKRGDTVCFVGFGSGLTYGSIIFEY